MLFKTILLFAVAKSALGHSGHHGDERTSTAVDLGPSFNPSEAIRFESTGIVFPEPSTATPTTIRTPIFSSATPSGITSTLRTSTTSTTTAPTRSTSEPPSSTESAEQTTSTGSAERNRIGYIAVVGGMLPVLMLL